jgi:hypothetical protein
MFFLPFYCHQIEEVEDVKQLKEEVEEEEVMVEEETTTLGEVNFIVAIVIKMVTLKTIVLRRRETTLKKILFKMKVINDKLCF